MTHTKRILAGLLFLLLCANITEAKRGKKKERKRAEAAAIALLSADEQQWLQMVGLFIADREREVFLSLADERERDDFITRWWKARDPDPRTWRNEFQERVETSFAFAIEHFNIERLKTPEYDQRYLVLMLNGFPSARATINCNGLYPLEVWQYERGTSNIVHRSFQLLFVGNTTRGGTFRLWEPFFGLKKLASGSATARDSQVTLEFIWRNCGWHADTVRNAILFLQRENTLLAAVLRRPEHSSSEWANSFLARSTNVPEGAETFDAELELAATGKHQSRTTISGRIIVPAAELTLSEFGGVQSYHLLLNGVVVRKGETFSSFRLRYTVPLAEVHTDQVVVGFDQNLRLGSYTMQLRLEDTVSGRFHQQQVDFTIHKRDPQEKQSVVPQPIATPASAPPPLASPPPPAVAPTPKETVPPSITVLEPFGDYQTGLVRFNAMSQGTFTAVRFILDGETVLTKKEKPWSAELDLGTVPRQHTLRAEALNAKGEVVASDELVLNGGPNRFAVELTEPKGGRRYTSGVTAQAEIDAPHGTEPARVELYLNDSLVATLFAPPWEQEILLPDDAIHYIRAVAYLPDGRTAEDIAFVNAPGFVDEISTDMVELYISVLNKKRRPVDELVTEDFAVFEDGTRQNIRRLEHVSDMPLNVAVTLDMSTSMLHVLDDVRSAALTFFERVVTPRDRAALISFNHHTNLAVPFTADKHELALGLAGLKAEGGTALYDTLVFALYQLNGVKGQRAVLLLSDGRDEGSAFTYDEVLEYARHAGVTIYGIGLRLGSNYIGQDGKPLKERTRIELSKTERYRLQRISAETGGRAFFLEDTEGLAGVYAEIEQELRSRYLLAYQSSGEGTDFREIFVRVHGDGLTAQTVRGYYP